MNHIFRVVFNRSLGLWQAVGETARTQGKSSRRATTASSAGSVAAQACCRRGRIRTIVSTLVCALSVGFAHERAAAMYITIDPGFQVDEYGSLSVDGGTIFSGGTLKIHGLGELSNNGDLHNHGLVINDGGNLFNFGRLFNTGVLSTGNTYALWNMVGGELYIGSDEAGGSDTGELLGWIRNQGTLVFNRNRTSEYQHSGRILSTGTVTKTGTGVLDLRGNTGGNDIQSVFNIDQGTVRISQANQLSSLNNLKMRSEKQPVMEDLATVLSTAITSHAAAPTAENSAALNLAQAAWDAAVLAASNDGSLATLVVDAPGGVIFDGAGAMAQRLVFVNNAASIGIADYPVDPLIVENSFIHDTDGVNGGVVYSEGSQLSLTSMEFNDNEVGAGGFSNGVGGVISAIQGQLSLRDVAFNRNSISGGNWLFGGAIAINSHSQLSLTDAVFNGNSMTAPGFTRGGAIYGYYSQLSLTDVTFDGNLMSSGTASLGGAIYTEHSQLSLTDATFVRNSMTGALASGGAIALFHSPMSLTVTPGRTSLFSGNTANGIANGILIQQTGSLAVAVQENATLDMRDALNGNAASSATPIRIDKSGSGLWKLGGPANFASQSGGGTEFTVTDGTLYLYGDAEVRNDGLEGGPPTAYVAAGEIHLYGSASRFTLGGGDGFATLQAGGENRVQTEGSIHLLSGAAVDGGDLLTLQADGGIVLNAAVSDDLITLGGNVYLEGDMSKIGLGTVRVDGNLTVDRPVTVTQGLMRVAEGAQFTVAGGANALLIEHGAILSGTGTVSGATVGEGGIVAPGNSLGVLTVAGNLTLTPGSILEYELGTPGTLNAPTAGKSDRIDVLGDLTLAGTLNLSQSTDTHDGTVGSGYYRLITYTGALDNQGLVIGTKTGLPQGTYSLSLGPAANGYVDLLVKTEGGGPVQHWVAGTADWTPGSLTWSNQPGDDPAAWNGSTGVFKDVSGGEHGAVVTVHDDASFQSLQFVDKGYVLGGPGALTTAPEGSELRVLAESARIDTRITGDGALVKTGAGALILAGSNDYAGGTRLRDGVLAVSSDSNLGAASGAINLDGGSLRVMGDTYQEIGRSVTLGASGGQIEVHDAGHALRINAAITSLVKAGADGGLTVTGAGRLILAGQNSYTGLTTVRSAQGLQIGAGANSGAVSGNIHNESEVVFSRGDQSYTHAGAIAGPGRVIKVDKATLRLTGVNTFAGGLIVDGGTVMGEAASLGQGDIHNRGAVVFDQVHDAVFAGVVREHGELRKTGVGALTLTGNSRDYAGSTEVQAGTLYVGAGGQGALGGTVSVAHGATLAGSGTVGSVGLATTIHEGATLAPGNSIGTLSVAGDLVFAPGSVFEVQVNDAGQTAKVQVAGHAALAGTVLVDAEGSGFAPRTAYTILTAGSVSNRFDDVRIGFDYEYLLPELAYTDQSISLVLVRKDGLHGAARTRNQYATADGIESLAQDHAVYRQIETAQAGRVPQMLDALSGELHASARSVLLDASTQVRERSLHHARRAVHGAHGGAMSGVSGADTHAGRTSHSRPLWVDVLASRQVLNGDGNASGVKHRLGGIVLGGDAVLAHGWQAGGSFAYTDSRIEVNDLRSKADVDTYGLAFTGGKTFASQKGSLTVLAGAGYSWHSLATRRNTGASGLAQILKADYRAATAQVFGEAGYTLAVGDAATVTPFAGVAWQQLRSGSLQETGGSAALHGQSGRQDMTSTTLGLRAQTDVSKGTTQASLRGMLGWRHAFGDRQGTAALAFDAGQEYVVQGVPLARDTALLELGGDVRLSKQATLGVAYGGRFGGGNREHSGNVNVRWQF